MQPKLFVGPVSKNIIDACIDFVNTTGKTLGLIPSRRQVEIDGGYVYMDKISPFKTSSFARYVKFKTKNILLVRDHCGPKQGKIEDDGVESFMEDCRFFDVIHIDPWKKYPIYKDGLEATISFIEKGSVYNPFIKFEIGTEQAIKEFTPELLNKFVEDLKNRLRPKLFDKIAYLVVQSGTSLKGNINTGEYSEDRLTEMLSICKKFNLISKEHNGDYLDTKLIKRKFKLGLRAINIAPEFGKIESSYLVKKMESSPGLIEEFFRICRDSNTWQKWVDKTFIPDENKLETINICGHYVFSYPSFQNLKQKLGKEIDLEIQTQIKKRIKQII